jgi:hypothetical protein
MHYELCASLRVQSYTTVAAISKMDGNWPEDMDMHVYYRIELMRVICFDEYQREPIT